MNSDRNVLQHDQSSYDNWTGDYVYILLDIICICIYTYVYKLCVSYFIDVKCSYTYVYKLCVFIFHRCNIDSYIMKFTYLTISYMYQINNHVQPYIEIKKIVNLTTLLSLVGCELSLWQPTVPPVATKFSNWWPFVFNVSHTDEVNILKVTL